MIKWHSLKIKNNEKLVEQAFEVFSSRQHNKRLPDDAKYISCHSKCNEWFYTECVLEDCNKEVYSLDKLFSINEALLLKYLKSKTKLGELL